MQNETDDKRHNAASGSMGKDRSNEKRDDSSNHGAHQGQHSHEHKEADKPFRKDSDLDRGSSKPDDRGQRPHGGHSGQGQPQK